MNWFLIINDTDCRTELESFLRRHSDCILLKSEIDQSLHNISRVVNGFSNMAGSNARMVINAASSVNVLKICNIISCESQRSYTLLHLNDGTKLTVTKTLKQFEQELGHHQFVRIHQSHLVNLNYITKYIKSKGGYVSLENGAELPVATRKKELLLEKLERL
ncbi:MAG: LytR/AlgR family response regulator transcription factor [Bacteroidia bacterium]